MALELVFMIGAVFVGIIGFALTSWTIGIIAICMSVVGLVLQDRRQRRDRW